jgi:hypothetical protein
MNENSAEHCKALGKLDTDLVVIPPHRRRVFFVCPAGPGWVFYSGAVVGSIGGCIGL